MTDKQIMEHYENLKRIFGDGLPDPDHQPILFAYYVKLYKTYHKEEYEHVQAN
jgi:hypothetical protein